LFEKVILLATKKMLHMYFSFGQYIA